MTQVKIIQTASMHQSSLFSQLLSMIGAIQNNGFLIFQSLDEAIHHSIYTYNTIIIFINNQLIINLTYYIQITPIDICRLKG